MVPAREVLCGSCWPLVPREVQKAVRAAHKEWNTDPTDEAWFRVNLWRDITLHSLPWDTTGR